MATAAIQTFSVCSIFQHDSQYVLHRLHKIPTRFVDYWSQVNNNQYSESEVCRYFDSHNPRNSQINCQLTDVMDIKVSRLSDRSTSIDRISRRVDIDDSCLFTNFITAIISIRVQLVDSSNVSYFSFSLLYRWLCTAISTGELRCVLRTFRNF